MLARTVERIKAFLAPVMGDRRGAAAMLLAFTMIPMFGAVGLAVDSSLGYLLRSRMSKALDTAGLAAGRVALNDNAEEVAQEYFDANFGTGEGAAELTEFTFDLDETQRFVTLTARATTPTFFMRIFGRDEMEVASRTVIERETTGMELALVLDNTGSMQDDDKFEGMEQAAFDLIEILYGPDDDVIDNLWVSVVPFITTVNIGTSHKSWMKTNDRVYTSPNSWGTPSTWKGCVLARAHPLDVNDTPPSGGLFSSYRWVNNLPSGANGSRNYACPAPIKGLMASRTEIDAALTAMTVGPKASGTATGYGLVWGWRTLSPNWRGLWGGSTPADMPFDYDIDGEEEDGMDKVAVVLTDGQNQLVYDHLTSYGHPSALGFGDTLASRPMLDERMDAVCDAMKAEGILIYSIMFGQGNDADAQQLLEDCATTPAMYYYAVTNEELADAFDAIGGQLANLRIVE